MIKVVIEKDSENELSYLETLKHKNGGNMTVFDWFVYYHVHWVIPLIMGFGVLMAGFIFMGVLCGVFDTDYIKYAIAALIISVFFIVADISVATYIGDK